MNKPTQKDIDRYAMQRTREEAQAAKMLAELGYSKESLPADLWRQVLEQACRNHMLRKANRYQVDGKATEHTLLHKLRFPNEALAQQFISTLAGKRPEIRLRACIRPVECLEDREVELTHQVLMTAPDVTRVCSQILEVAHIYLADDYHWLPLDNAGASTPPPPISFQAWPSRPKRTMRMRTEFYGDLVLARLILAPWVCRWTDVEGRSYDTDGAKTAVSSLDGHEVEFELANDAVTLDQLRWLLNQATDLHVAAESLNYADCYTGERLHYSYLRRMAPSDDVLASLKKSLAQLESFRDAIVERLDGLLQELCVPLESDELDGEAMLPFSNDD